MRRFAPEEAEFSKLWISMTQTNRDKVMALAARGKCNARQVYLDAARCTVSRVKALFEPAANKNEKSTAAAKKPRWWWEALPKADQRRLKRAFRPKRRVRGYVVPDLLARSERAYLKLHMEEALDDAVHLSGEGPVRAWMRGPLVERARAGILGTLKGKPGRRSDWMQDDIWFEMIQDRRDNDMSMTEALDQTLTELRYYARGRQKNLTKKERAFHYPKENTLRTAYYRHKKKVRRGYVRGLGRCWVPRANVYVPRLSVLLPKKVL
jgi:hypothetical protein